MKNFFYEAVNPDGRMTTGEIAGDDEDDARARLSNLGIVPRVFREQNSTDEHRQAFEFSGKRTDGTEVTGTIDAKSRADADERLRNEFALGDIFIGRARSIDLDSEAKNGFAPTPSLEQKLQNSTAKSGIATDIQIFVDTIFSVYALFFAGAFIARHLSENAFATFFRGISDGQIFAFLFPLLFFVYVIPRSRQIFAHSFTDAHRVAFTLLIIFALVRIVGIPLAFAESLSPAMIPKMLALDWPIAFLAAATFFLRKKTV